MCRLGSLLSRPRELGYLRDLVVLQIGVIAAVTAFGALAVLEPAVVPSVPGFVSDTVVPSKSDTFSFPDRARETTSSAAAANSTKRIFSAPSMPAR